MGNLIRSQSLQGYAGLVRSLGGDPVELMGRFQITPAMLANPDSFLPFRHLNGLLEASAQLLDCPDFGLRLSRQQGLEVLGPVAVVARSAGSIAQALQAIADYLPLHSPALRLSAAFLSTDLVKFSYEILEPRLAETRQVSELSLGIGLQTLKILAGPEARPAAVFFPHAPLLDAGFYRDFFGCRVQFGQASSGMLMPFGLLAQSIADADSATHRLARQYLDSMVPPGAQQRFGDYVSHLVRRLLPAGQCTLAAVATQLCISMRTLQRRLDNEGLLFDELVDRERRDLAAYYVSTSRMPLSQVTGLLGYTEQSTFIRAFRRWFGVTPREFRTTPRPPLPDTEPQVALATDPVP
ncbi:MAG: AraC family transcriptional regulator [Moraxellaceae bacterium]|jgi:AraC-like DNA-binding protein|nr:AraC family transcriptional regulator [Moraxellaceae bacterium]